MENGPYWITDCTLKLYIFRDRPGISCFIRIDKVAGPFDTFSQAKDVLNAQFGGGRSTPELPDRTHTQHRILSDEQIDRAWEELSEVKMRGPLNP